MQVWFWICGIGLLGVSAVELKNSGWWRGDRGEQQYGSEAGTYKLGYEGGVRH